MNKTKIKINKEIFKNKEFLISNIFLILLIFIYALFPIEDKFQQAITPFIFFVVIPILFLKFILKREMADYGLRIGDYKKGFLWSSIGFIVSLCFLLLLLNYSGLKRNYSLPSDVVDSFWQFLLFELIATLFFVAIYDFFFRGFIMFSFEKYYGNWSIIFQFLIFTVLVFLIGTNVWSFVPYLVFAPFAGFAAYKSRSIIYSSMMQLLLIIFFDALIIYFIKSV